MSEPLPRDAPRPDDVLNAVSSAYGFADLLVEQWSRFDDGGRLEYLEMIRSRTRAAAEMLNELVRADRAD